MAHSFAIAPSDKPTDLSKAQDVKDRKVYADAGFTALAEEKPRAELAESHYPEMGDDKGAFLRFFSHFVDIERYVHDVDEEVAELIARARSLKVDDTEVFDVIDVHGTEDGSELLAFGLVQFGDNTLRFPIVQWRVPGDDVDTDSYTTIEEIKELRRKTEQDRKDREEEYLATEKAKQLRNRKVWGYPLLGLTLLMSVVVIYAPLSKSAGWLALGLLGSFIACVAAMIRSAVSKSFLCGIVAGIGFANVIGVLIGMAYLENIGVIK